MKLSDLMGGGQEKAQPQEQQASTESMQGESQSQQAPQEGAPPNQQGVNLEQPQTEEELQAKEQLTLAGVNILNQKAEEVLKMAQGKNAAKGLAAATDMVVQTVSEQMGANLPLNVLLYGGVEIMQEILVYAQSAGMEVTEETFGKAAQYYIFSLLQKNNISPEQIEPMFENTSDGEMQAMMKQQANYSMAG